FFLLIIVDIVLHVLDKRLFHFLYYSFLFPIDYILLLIHLFFVHLNLLFLFDLDLDFHFIVVLFLHFEYQLLFLSYFFISSFSFCPFFGLLLYFCTFSSF